jgi:hypothetical protein
VTGDGPLCLYTYDALTSLRKHHKMMLDDKKATMTNTKDVINSIAGDNVNPVCLSDFRMYCVVNCGFTFIA